MASIHRSFIVRPLLVAIVVVIGLGYMLNPAAAPAQLSLASLQVQIVALQAQITALENKLSCMEKLEDNVFFVGCNVHVRNGTGSSFSDVNGTGNLIIGYNETPPDLEAGDRGGSHNLIIGTWHKYPSNGGFVAGFQNSIPGRFASVSGGSENSATGYASSVSGGTGNEASGRGASGGSPNDADGIN